MISPPKRNFFIICCYFCFVPDNHGLFAFSLEEIPSAGWTLDAYTLNLHQDPVLIKGNIMTEYEEKFSSMGNPIYKLTAFEP